MFLTLDAYDLVKDGESYRNGPCQMVERISDQISNQYIKREGGMRLKMSGKKNKSEWSCWEDI